MNDEQFEALMKCLIDEVAEPLRARDTAQREALARAEADHEANGLEYGEALILIGQVLDCRSLEDLNAVRRYLNEFMDRYSLRPVPDVDLVQSDQQEAQGAQAGNEDAAFMVWAEREYQTAPDEELNLKHVDVIQNRKGWMARAALATQPAVGDPVAWMTRPRIGSHKGREFICEPDASLNLDQWEKPFPVYAAPPAAAHGDEAARKPSWKDEHEAFKSWARSRITPLKLDLDEVGLFYDEVAGVAHDAWHARAAMRAQGDGEARHG